jgi:acetyl esterase/lipase
MDPAEVLTRAAHLPDAVLRYADHDEALVDVRLPDGSAPHPLVVLLHGGFWKQQWDRRHTRPLADALAAEGFVVASPEYRRVGGGGGWPTTFDDVTTAMTALPDLLAGLGVRTTATTLVGHSAGGQLALWLANEEHPVDRVVALAPVGDLRAAARERLGDSATQALLGGGPDAVPDRYEAADPATRLHNRPRAEVVVVHGVDDAAVPVANSRGLAVRHPFVELRELPGVEHFALIDPRSSAWPAVLDAVRRPGTGHA